MAFTWTEEKIDLFKDASAYTGFHRQVAEEIKPYLDISWSLCDMGCGLGLLDIEISAYVSDITAVDLSEIAVKDYRKRLAESHIKNISIEFGDSDYLSGRTWDVILLSFFSKPGEQLERILNMAKKEVILITYEAPLSEQHGRLKKGDNRPTTADYEKHIKDNGYSYELIRKVMDFGQPFRNLDSARSYFEAWSREDDSVKRHELIDKNLKNVKPTGDAEFPYFLSKEKSIGIIIVKV